MIRVLKIGALLTCIVVCSACSVGQGLKLAVQCQTDEALHTLEAAEKGGGLTAELAILEREAVLREAGRVEEAEIVRAKRESQQEMTEEEKAEAEKAILETVENIREERKKQTGDTLCEQ